MNDLRRSLPAVSRLLEEAKSAGLLDRHSRALVVQAIRSSLAEARAARGEPPAEGWVAAIERHLAQRHRRSLRPAINATGVVLHTNLGRAPLALAARSAMADALGYCSLELDLETGERGSRQTHTASLLREITGAEAALVVVNAAAALLLVCNTLGEGGETIVSRGELVEIGDAFRLPEILQKSGTSLVEVGTTNRTRLRDYQLAISPRTKIALKVHRSNFRLTGFTSESSLADLVGLMKERGIYVVHDVGSGLLIDLAPFGLKDEPLVQESVAAGAIVVFSGDKLLGGPQAGIVLGPQEPLYKMARNPLFRALRPDKSIIAALEATLRLYRDPATALREIPTLAMLTADLRVLKRRARKLARKIEGAEVIPGSSSVGGGSFPETELPTVLVALPQAWPAQQVLALLRKNEPPVIARIENDRVVLDPRTIMDGELAPVVEAVRRVRAEVEGP
ncbi:MAG: L-seryl-tRNA(Sec) selenium transferase [Gemmatimonadales bacterium]|nr:MAG: L-seryl-tRNA(Sec) selenium transferase [Gemmatimonadales bacterium]